MTLQNLLKIQSLVEFKTQREDVQRLLSQTVVVLDGLRKKRNVNDYSGDPISPTLVDACMKQAQALLAHVRAWLAEHYPDFC